MVKKVILSGLVLLGLALNIVWSQSKFLGLEDFKEPLGDWFEAGNAKLNPDDEKKLTAIDGNGVLISEHGKTVNLVTKQNHGDIKVELDFMISKKSNSGVYLQGRYEIQIYDSWGKENPVSWDCGGIYERYDFARKNAQTLALFGCGAQGITQIEAIMCERDIKKVLVFDKNRNHAFRLLEEMEGKLNMEMVFCKDKSILNEADIICTATNATAPLFKIEEVKKGAHINAIGSFQPHMQELDPYLIRDAKVYVDLAEACLNESGDFIKAREAGIINDNPIVGEIGDYCLNKIPGRESEDEITIFKSVGVAIQDYAVAIDIYNFSLIKGFGQEINLFE